MLCVLAFFCSALVFVAVSAACVVVVGAAAVLTAPPCCCCGCEAEAEGAVVFPAAVELDDPLVLPVDSRAGVWGLLLLSAAEPSGLGSRLDCEEDWEVMDSFWPNHRQDNVCVLPEMKLCVCGGCSGPHGIYELFVTTTVKFRLQTSGHHHPPRLRTDRPAH